MDKALKMRNETKFNITYLQYLLNFVFQSNKLKVKQFSIADDFLNQKMDIVTYLETTKQFEILKQLNLNYYQNLSLSYIRNTDINNKDDVALADLMLLKNKNYRYMKDCNILVRSNFNEMIYYFKNNKANNTLSETDVSIIESLPDPIKIFINNI